MANLEIKNITKNFAGNSILKGININCADGEFLVLVGPSGCGKSTLLNIIAGLEEESTGGVSIGARDVKGVSPADRNIAMVFQSYALYPNMTVRKNILFGLEMRKVPREERDRLVDEVAKMLQIEALLDRKPAQLSGGQRQRVAMGRALVRKPDVFLFDEPLSNLDAKLRVEMRTEIKKLHQSLKTTTVYVTHDQVEAMTLATRIALMRDGRIEQLADPYTLYNAPANMFVAGFIGSPAMNFIPATIERVGTESGGVSSAWQMVLTNDSQNTKLRLPVTRPSDKLPSFDGQQVIVGLRPENITALSSSTVMTENYTAFDARIELLEPTGPDTLTSFKLGGVEVTARLKPNDVKPLGETLTFRVHHSKALVFDRKTQERI